MTNKEISTALKAKRKVAAFGRFLGISTRTVYNLLNSDKTKDSQYYNYILFLRSMFEK